MSIYSKTKQYAPAILFFLFALSMQGCVSTYKTSIASLQLENDRLQNQISGYKKNLNELAGNERSLQSVIKDNFNEIQKLKDDISVYQKEQQGLAEKVKYTEKEKDSLQVAKEALEETFRDEIGQYQAKLELTEKGLIITFIAEILFDSGKADIREQGKDALRKVASWIHDNLTDNMVAIEGHSDSDPITHSSWQSNWELSSARALSVLHYFIDECDLTPDRFSAVAYGEYMPRISNATDAGKRQNRRVEIVISPKLPRKKI